ncbi:hypothetical protein D9M72_393770 [compost metagenome]
MGQRFLRDGGGRIVGGQGARPAQGIQGLGTQRQRFRLRRPVREQRLDVAQHVLVGTEAKGLARGRQRTRHGPLGIARGEPVMAHQARCRTALREPRRHVAMQQHTPVRRDAFGQRVPHEGVAEAVAAIGDHQHARGQRLVEPRQGIVAFIGSQRHGRGHVEIFGRQGQPAQGLRRAGVQVAQAFGQGRRQAAGHHRRGAVRRGRTARELDHGKRQAFGTTRDGGGGLGRHRCVG